MLIITGINIKHLLDVDCKHNIAGYEIKLKSQMPTLQIINRRKNGVLALELIQLVRVCTVILIVSLSVSISIQLQSFYAFTPFKISLKRVDDDICYSEGSEHHSKYCIDLQIFISVGT